MPYKQFLFARLLFLLLLFVILGFGCGGSSHRPYVEDDGTHKWTFLVYMAADNNLEPYALMDFNELERVGSDANVSLVVQIDRSPEYDTSDGNWTTTRRYYITRDPDRARINSPLLFDLGELDMASPKTLADFVRWGTTNYPADHYVLILWNHGRGWQTRTMADFEPKVKAIHQDTTSGTEMSLNDLSQALSGMPKMDIVAFDACLMAMIEVAYVVRNAAAMMVASEENVPVEGQPYERVISLLKTYPGMPPRQVSERLVATYVEYYATSVANPVTYSAIDLTKLEALSHSVNQLAVSVLGNLPQVREAVQLAQRKAQWYDHDYKMYDYYKDLFDFAQLLKEYTANQDVAESADNVMKSFRDVIIAEAHSGAEVANSHGISIYLPESGTCSSRYPNLEFAIDTSWDEMLRSY